ncbi:MAG: type IV pili twitching motility protein PilT, partial [Alicyclobacillus sp.]|nr:type IV pili twitching motility protein PilT [Alicyclobacillus sp.]
MDNRGSADIREWLIRARESGASDLHISVNAPPVLRIHGELLVEGEPLRPEETEAMGRALTDERQWQVFCERGEVDFSYSIPGVSR